MNTSRTPGEIVEAYSSIGVKKANSSVLKLTTLGILAGALIAMGSAATNTAVFNLSNTSTIRTICGLLFPFGLAMVIVLGGELFTGNCLMLISVLDKKCSIIRMLRSWFIVYFSNLAGALMVAAACAFFGQFSYNNSWLAVYTVKLANAKCSISFLNALGSGFLCNFLVCLGVLMALSAKDTAGRILGAFLPVCYFVICGFEHSVANMYYISAGLFASLNPAYAQALDYSCLDYSSLTTANFILKNLLPVTIGNILGGAALSLIMWLGHKKAE